MARGAKGFFKIISTIVEFSTGIGISSSDKSVPHVVDYEHDVQTGTSDGQGDRVWSSASGSVVALSPVTLDLSGSIASQLDSGTTVVLVDLQAVVIKNTATSGNLIIGKHAANVGFISGGTSGGIILPPGGEIAIWLGTAGLGVTNASTDVLQFDASTGTVTYELMFFGRSA